MTPPRLAVVFATALAGCTDRPQAPPLRNDPVFQDAAAGFRFLVPDGWTMMKRSTLPPGPLDKPQVLVAFQRRGVAGASRSAAFEVICADLPETADLAAHLARAGPGKDGWRVTKPPEPVPAGNAQGVRVTLAGRAGNEGAQKEVVAVRRGGRAYFFAVTAPAADAAAREQARRAVGSLMWKE